VIGREFAALLLRRITDIQEQLDDCLSALKNLEFIYEKSVFPDLEYIFKHVLTQEAAYNSLLSSRRTQLHTAIGLAMEELYQERLTEHCEELAHHFIRGEAWEKAFLYLCKSADKARQAYANHEAVALYTQAVEVSDRITPTLDATQLLPVYEGRGLVWILLTKYDEAIADFHMMRQLARASGNQQKEGESLCHLAYTYWIKMSEDQMPVVEQYAQEALQLSQQTGDQKILAKTLTNLGLMHQTRGNLQEANRHMEESLQIGRREGYRIPWPKIFCGCTRKPIGRGGFNAPYNSVRRVWRFPAKSMTVSVSWSISPSSVLNTGVWETTPRLSRCCRRGSRRRRSGAASTFSAV